MTGSYTPQDIQGIGYLLLAERRLINNQYLNQPVNNTLPLRPGSSAWATAA